MDGERLTERMVIDEMLAPALLLLPQAGHRCVHERLDGVVQPELLVEPGPLHLDAAPRARRPPALHSLQQARFANCPNRTFQFTLCFVDSRFKNSR